MFNFISFSCHRSKFGATIKFQLWWKRQRLRLKSLHGSRSAAYEPCKYSFNRSVSPQKLRDWCLLIYNILYYTCVHLVVHHVHVHYFISEVRNCWKFAAHCSGRIQFCDNNIWWCYMNNDAMMYWQRLLFMPVLSSVIHSKRDFVDSLMNPFVNVYFEFIANVFIFTHNFWDVYIIKKNWNVFFVFMFCKLFIMHYFVT